MTLNSYRSNYVGIPTDCPHREKSGWTCDVMLAVPRAFRRADYLPCILWGRTALDASRCSTRDQLRICGRLQSRVYTKVTGSGSEERTAYEISALSAQMPEDVL